MTEPGFGHDVLRNRYRFAGKLKVESPLRLSSGRASEVTDAPLMRDRGGRIYLPGSSLRGALRSEIERILAGVEVTGLRCCSLFVPEDGDAACPTASRGKQKSLTELEEKARRPEAEPEQRAAPLAFLARELCDVCKLFGSPLYASRLVVEDALPEPAAALASTVRDGVGIDRDTGKARDGVKFNYEVLESGPAFCLRMQVENLTPPDRRLLSLAFALLRQGLHVGGKRAAGLGRIRLEGDLAVDGFERPDELWQALLAGRDPHRKLAFKESLHAEA